MIPATILNRMRIGLTAAGMALTLTGCGMAERQAPPATLPPQAPAPVARLSTEQQQIFAQNFPLLVSKNGVEGEQAWNTLISLGKNALPAIETEAKNTANSAELRGRLEYLKRWIMAGGDPCPYCGMG